MNSNATFAMTHFLKLCYNVFILENKIDALLFRKTCVNLSYIMLKIALRCVNMDVDIFILQDYSSNDIHSLCLIRLVVKR
jgi:hypothetical protein